MPATTEILNEQISQLKEKISIAKKNGSDTTDLEIKVSELNKKLLSTITLFESKQILKG